MTEVYKALSALGCEWLQLSSYRIKCRWMPNKGNAPPSAASAQRAEQKRRREDSADEMSLDDEDLEDEEEVRQGVMRSEATSTENVLLFYYLY